MTTARTFEQRSAFLLGKVITQSLRETYQAFDGDLTMALVLGELGSHSAAPMHEASHHKRSRDPRGSNAYSISAASGIPRETVRRKLDKLIARGWVIETPDGKLGLNLEHEPPLVTLFADYNRRLLQNMREAIALLDEGDTTAS